MTEVLLTTKVLPVRVLSPSGHDLFIADVAQALEQLQANHQAKGMDRPANAFRIQTAKLALQSFPVDLASQSTRLVTQINQIDKLLAKQVNIGVMDGLA